MFLRGGAAGRLGVRLLRGVNRSYTEYLEYLEYSVLYYRNTAGSMSVICPSSLLPRAGSGGGGLVLSAVTPRSHVPPPHIRLCNGTGSRTPRLLHTSACSHVPSIHLCTGCYTTEGPSLILNTDSGASKPHGFRQEQRVPDACGIRITSQTAKRT